MYDVVIIGGGIVGLATGHMLLKNNPRLRLTVLEKEAEIGQHQTGHNSGVIHSGIYYKPGSLKAKNCRRGIDLLLKFCNNNGIPYEMCGKLIVATREQEIDQLHDLQKRGVKNGIKGIKYVLQNELKDYEPHVSGVSALYCPETGIVDYNQVCKKLSESIQKDNTIRNNTEVLNISERSDYITISTGKIEFKAKFLINCAGLFSDIITELAGIKRTVRIIPFRGEYYMLKKEARYLVKNLIYPVPDPRYPFLGVHFTRNINGTIEAGPNAVLAWAREGYKKTDVNFYDMLDYLSYKGFWRMAGKYWNTALEEYYRSFFKSAFVASLQKLVPSISKDDIVHKPSGVRAQALSSDGLLVDDFTLSNVRKMIHVVNAPSPAATSCLAIGERLAKMYFKSQ